MRFINGNFSGYDSLVSVPQGSVVNIASAYLVRDGNLGTSLSGNTATVTTMVGYNCEDLTKGGSNYAFRGQVSSGTNKYNLYMDGTAQNYMKGNLQVDGTMTVSALAFASIGTSASAGFGILTFNGAFGGGNIAVYGTATCTSGFAAGFAATDAIMILQPAGAAIGSATVTLVASPFNGQQIYLGCANTITALVIATPAGTTIANPPTTFTTKRGYQFVFHTPSTTWFGIN